MTPHFVLIDDSALVRRSWEVSAKSSQILLNTYKDVPSFLLANHNKNVVIYLDRNLSEGMLGEREALKLIQLGFGNISLCTTMSAFDFVLPKTVCLYESKSPPWDKDYGI